MNNAKILALDFDGTMVNSIEEVTLVTYCCLTNIRTLNMEDIDPRFIAIFTANRFHAQSAGDFLPLGDWCLNKIMSANSRELTYQNILSRENYSKLSMKAPNLLQRTKNFFSVRTEIANLGTEAWANMSKPYLPLWGVLKNNLKQFVVLTNKDKKAVVAISNYWSLDLEASQIYSGDNGMSKSENLSCIIHARPNHEISFVDDSISNLLEVQKSTSNWTPGNSAFAKVNFFLATWGYTEQNDHITAKTSKISCIDQNDLIAMLNERHEPTTSISSAH